MVTRSAAVAIGNAMAAVVRGGGHWMPLVHGLGPPCPETLPSRRACSWTASAPMDTTPGRLSELCGCAAVAVALRRSVPGAGGSGGC